MWTKKTVRPAQGPYRSRRYSADFLGLSERTIDRLIKTGALGASRIGRCVRIPHGELERLAAEGRLK